MSYFAQHLCAFPDSDNAVTANQGCCDYGVKDQGLLIKEYLRAQWTTPGWNSGIYVDVFDYPLATLDY